MSVINVANWNSGIRLGYGSGFISDVVSWTERLFDPEFDEFSSGYYEWSASEYSYYDTIIKARGKFSIEQKGYNWYEITSDSKYQSVWVSSDVRGIINAYGFSIKLSDAKKPSKFESELLKGDDTIIGPKYDDNFNSQKGDDYIDSGAGNDSVDGGSGTDKVAFSGPSSSFKVTSNGSNITVEDLRSGSPDGTDVLTNIEEIQFTDRTITSDVALAELGPSTSYSQNSFDYKIMNLGNGQYGIKGDNGTDDITGFSNINFADQSLNLTNDIKATFDQVTGMDQVNGVIFRLYNAAFARLPDPDGLSNWINANSDGSFSYEQTANEFVNSQESINRYGSNQGDTDYITTVYNNVLDRDPDSAGLSHYEGLLGSGEMSRAEMMFAFSESPENRILFTEVTGIS